MLFCVLQILLIVSLNGGLATFIGCDTKFSDLTITFPSIVVCPRDCPQQNDHLVCENEMFIGTNYVCSSAIESGLITIMDGGEVAIMVSEQNLPGELTTGCFAQPRLFFFSGFTRASANTRDDIRCEISDCFAGLKDGSVKDHQFNSSSHVGERFPYKARLDGPEFWRPKTKFTSYWIQVDFERNRQVTGIVTQEDSLGYSTWVTKFSIMYRKDNDEIEKFVTDDLGEPKVFKAESYTINRFPEVVQARYIRLNVLEWRGKPRLRMEYLTC